MRRVPGLLIMFMLFSRLCFGAHGVKAILLAGRDTQNDTIGYNIVADMSNYVYGWLQAGQVQLWDSPEKKHRIGSQELKAIENTTGTAFTKLPSLFIYETWNYNKHEFGFNLRGFSFVTRNGDGEDVLYGYVELSDSLKRLLQGAYLGVNMSATYGLTLWQALMNKSYDFDLLYFDDAPVRDIRRSYRIKKSVIGNKKKLNQVTVPDARLIEYVIESGPSKYAERSVYLIKQLEKFFNQNPQEFYNYGGDQIYSYLKKAPVIITDLHVSELLILKDSVVAAKPLLITPYVVGLPLKPIPISKLTEWKLMVDGHSWEEELWRKKFYFRLTKINETIVPKDVEKIGRASLFSGEWKYILPQTQ